MEIVGLQVGWGIPGGAPLAFVLGIGLTVLAVLGSRPRVQGVGRRAVLIALRWVSAVAMFLLAAQPAFWGERVKKQPGVRAVLIDSSQSMGIAVDGPSRAERLRQLAARWANTEAGRKARWYEVDDGLRGLDAAHVVTRKAKATGAASDLVGALRELEENVPDLGAVLLLSDGADTSGKPFPKSLTVQVHTVAVDDARELKDDAITHLHADPVAFLHGEGRVQATLRTTGLGARSLNLSLARGEKVLSTQTVQVEPDKDASIELPFTPEALGREVYTLRVERHTDDDVPDNNARVFLVNVTRERLRVLHVSGRPSWDQRFLRGFLKRDPSIDLISFFILRSVHDLTNSQPSELALIPFPTDELFRQHLTSFDLVILQDFDYEPYQMAPYLPLIREYVGQGGGLAMIGGSLSFDGGGYAETPLAAALPVRIRPSDPGSASIVEGEFVPQPVTALMHHPILDLSADAAQTRATFQRLAPLDGANRLLGVNERSVALLEHPSERIAGAGRMPVLAVGNFGKGRTLAFGTDTSWHWSMPTAGRGGDPATYDRFWDRVVRFLTRDPLLDPSRVQTTKAQYAPEVPIDVTGVARDEQYTPIASTEVTLEVRSLNGVDVSRTSVRTDAAGKLSARFQGPREVGVYEVLLSQADKPLASSPFLVELSGEELSAPKPRPDLMRALARVKSAKFVESPEDAPGLDAFDATRTESLGIERSAPFGEPLGVALLLALMCLEWALRRRWGEV